MTDLNHLVLIGRLTRNISDDEKSFFYTGNGQAVANISIAVNRSKKNGDEWVDETSFFDVTVFGKQAEGLKPYLTKGQQIAVDGYLKQDRWEKDGQKHSKISIVANNIQLVGGAKKENVNNAPKFTPDNNENQPNETFSGANGDFPEDIPF